MVNLEAGVKALTDISQQGVGDKLLPVASLSPETKNIGECQNTRLVWQPELSSLTRLKRPSLSIWTQSKTTQIKP